jgi:hypothetical protein
MKSRAHATLLAWFSVTKELLVLLSNCASGNSRQLLPTLKGVSDVRECVSET